MKNLLAEAIAKSSADAAVSSKPPYQIGPLTTIGAAWAYCFADGHP